MKRLYRLISGIIVLALLGAIPLSGVAETAAELNLPQLDDCFTERDLFGTWDATATQIALEGDTAVIASHVVDVAGGMVTIVDGGVYVLSGTLDDGQIVVDVKDDEKVQLVLNGVSITCSDSAAILVRQADKVFITLAEGTENTLANGGEFAEEGVDAVIWSDEDLTFNGTGTLIIDSPAGDGIDGNDDVKFASGSYVITAAGRGVDANDSIRVAGGDFTVTTQGTAFRADHDTNADLGYIYIWDGSFTIVTGDGAGEFQTQDGMMGMMGGMQGRMAFDGEAMTPPGFSGEDGEMPTPPEFTGEDGEMPTPPEFTGEEGEMPTPPDFTGEEGEMPTPPEFTGEEGDMPTEQGTDGDSTFQPPQGGMGSFRGAATEEDAEADGTSRKGFKASGDIVIIGGSFDLDTADDAFHADGDLLVFDGTIAVASADDGLHADGRLTVAGGIINIAQSSEGLEAEVIALSGGSVALIASDDGLNARSSTGDKESFEAQEGVLIQISGGTLYVNASGDGIDSNGDILITGGTVVVSGPENNMNGALDCNGTATVSGGTVVAAGASHRRLRIAVFALYSRHFGVFRRALMWYTVCVGIPRSSFLRGAGHVWKEVSAEQPESCSHRGDRQAHARRLLHLQGGEARRAAVRQPRGVQHLRLQERGGVPGADRQHLQGHAAPGRL